MGQYTVFGYDENFRKLYQVQATWTPDEALTWFGYDAVGNMNWTQDPRGQPTTFGYDERNRQTTATDALGRIATTYYDPAGNKNWVKRATGTSLETIVQFVEYDPMNRLKEQIDERGVHTYLYYEDAARNLTSQKDGNGNTYFYSYDLLKRKTVMTYPPDSGSAVRTETWTYDIAGNLQVYKNRAGNRQIFTYDERNRPVRFDWDDGYTSWQTTHYDAASNITQVANWDATINSTYWDDNALKTQQELTGSNYNHTTAYTYDANGNRQSIACPSTTVWQYAYNGRNQLARIMNANQVVLASYQYDRAGNRQQRSLYNGTVTEYAPADALNRSSWVRHSFNGVEAARFDYAFDELNRLKYEQRDGGAADGYGYDAADQVTGFNRDGALSNGTVTGGSQVATLGYDPAGNRAQVTSNGATTAWSVNNLNQYANANGGAAGSDLKGNLQSYNGWTYTYDAQNRLTSAVNGGTSVEFWYDGLNRQITRRINGGAARGTRPERRAPGILPARGAKR
jgi:YD repeat-containing protein